MLKPQCPSLFGRGFFWFYPSAAVVQMCAVVLKNGVYFCWCFLSRLLVFGSRLLCVGFFHFVLSRLFFFPLSRLRFFVLCEIFPWRFFFCPAPWRMRFEAKPHVGHLLHQQWPSLQGDGRGQPKAGENHWASAPQFWTARLQYAHERSGRWRTESDTCGGLVACLRTGEMVTGTAKGLAKQLLAWAPFRENAHEPPTETWELAHFMARGRPPLSFLRLLDLSSHSRSIGQRLETGSGGGLQANATRVARQPALGEGQVREERRGWRAHRQHAAHVRKLQKRRNPNGHGQTDTSGHSTDTAQGQRSAVTNALHVKWDVLRSNKKSLKSVHLNAVGHRQRSDNRPCGFHIIHAMSWMSACQNQYFWVVQRMVPV